jgi:hypothetical protein
MGPYCPRHALAAISKGEGAERSSTRSPSSERPSSAGGWESESGSAAKRIARTLLAMQRVSVWRIHHMGSAPSAALPSAPRRHWRAQPRPADAPRSVGRGRSPRPLTRAGGGRSRPGTAGRGPARPARRKSAHSRSRRGPESPQRHELSCPGQGVPADGDRVEDEPASVDHGAGPRSRARRSPSKSWMPGPGGPKETRRSPRKRHPVVKTAAQRRCSG